MVYGWTRNAFKTKQNKKEIESLKRKEADKIAAQELQRPNEKTKNKKIFFLNINKLCSFCELLNKRKFM